MSKKAIGLAAAALTGLFVVSTSVAPALAAHGGGGGGGHGGGGHSFSGGGGHSPGGGRSVSGRSSSTSGARVYGYTARGGRHGHGHGHGRGFIGVPYGYGYYDDGYYYGGSCSYEYNRAVATGSAYWWNRYRDCID